jgi:hypothetical protein
VRNGYRITLFLVLLPRPTIAICQPLSHPSHRVMRNIKPTETSIPHELLLSNGLHTSPQSTHLSHTREGYFAKSDASVIVFTRSRRYKRHSLALRTISLVRQQDGLDCAKRQEIETEEQEAKAPGVYAHLDKRHLHFPRPGQSKADQESSPRPRLEGFNNNDCAQSPPHCSASAVPIITSTYIHNGTRRPLRDCGRFCRPSPREILLARSTAEHLDDCHARDSRIDSRGECAVYADSESDEFGDAMVRQCTLVHFNPLSTTTACSTQY